MAGVGTLAVKDREGRASARDMADLFEQCVKTTPLLNEQLNLQRLGTTSDLVCYLNPDTQTVFLGFAIGFRLRDQASFRQ